MVTASENALSNEAKIIHFVVSSEKPRQFIFVIKFSNLNCQKPFVDRLIS